MLEKIDFIVTWVDGGDSEWLKSRAQYAGEDLDINLNTGDRFRDWGFMKYWFRAVEKNASWVNKIYFVTEGHLPEWINLRCEKLVHIKHKDYINSKYLPTFNSNVIELNFHKIKGLSDQFVLFNDDMLINQVVSPGDFFENGKPKDTGIFSPIVPSRGTIGSIVLNNIEIINDYFDSRGVLKKHFFKFFNVKYNKHIIKNLCVLPWGRILGFYDSHIPVCYKKATFQKLWELEEEILTETSSHRFRTGSDVNHWLMRYWQLSQGDFKPRKETFGKYYNIYSDLDSIIEDISFSKHALICLNDGEVTDFKYAQEKILDAFEKKYPDKSIFEN